MKAVRRTKELSINQMSIMVANLKEFFNRDAAMVIEVSSYKQVTFQFYLGSVRTDSKSEAALIKYFNTWEKLQNAYFELMSDSHE
jgi:hypothetical protein